MLDLTTTDEDLKGFVGGFASGGYGYFVPYSNGPHPVGLTGPYADGKVARVDLATFSQVQVLDLTLTDAALKGFAGGFASDGYGYVVPYNNGVYFGKVARFDLATFSQVQVLDLTATDRDLVGFWGGFASGGYGYFLPNENYAGGYSAKVARVDLATFAQVQVLDLTATDADLKGFVGGFTSGGYGYVVPYSNGAYFGKVARFDLATFSQVLVLDLAATDADLQGFIDGFASDGYGYVVPYFNGGYFGKVARFSVDPQGSSIVLIRLG